MTETAIMSLLVRRDQLRQQLREHRGAPCSEALVKSLKRIKSRLYYYRHRDALTSTASKQKYTKRRVRYLTRQLNALQALPADQPVSLSRTAAELRARLEAIAKIEAYLREEINK